MLTQAQRWRQREDSEQGVSGELHAESEGVAEDATKSLARAMNVEGLGSKGEVWAGGRHRGHQRMEAAKSSRERGRSRGQGEPAEMTKTEGPGQVEDRPSVA